MLETHLFGKLLPTQPGIMSILLDIRTKYHIPEITSYDDGLQLPHAHALLLRGDSTEGGVERRTFRSFVRGSFLASLSWCLHDLHASFWMQSAGRAGRHR
jgi:hypothetical protein